MNWTNDPPQEAPRSPAPAAGNPPGAPVPPDSGDLLNLMSSIESQFTQLRKLKDEQAQAVAQVTSQRQELEEKGKRVHEALERLKKKEEEFAVRDQESQQRLAQAEAKLKEFQERERALADKAEQLRELEREARAAQEASVRERAEFDRIRTEVESTRQQIEHQREELLQREEAVSSQQRALETLREDVELRERSLQESGQSSRQMEQAATAALQQAQAMSQRMSEREEALAEREKKLQVQLEQLKHDSSTKMQGVQRAEKDLAELRTQLEDRTKQLEAARASLQAAESRAAKLEAEVNEVERKLAQAPAAASIAEVEKRDKAIGVLKQRLEEAATLVKNLKSELETARKQPPAAKSSPRADKFIASRRARLKRYKSLLEQQARKVKQINSSLQKKQKEYEQVIAIRSQVEQEKAVVAKAKETIERKAAKGRAGMFVCSLVIMLGVIAAMSWEIAGRIKPATFLAQVTLGMEGGAASAPAENRQSWQSFHEQLVLDPQLLEQAADRLKRRGILELANPSDLRSRLSSDLDISSTSVGELTLTLRGEGDARTERILETFSTALISTANSTRDRRADRTSTVIISAARADTQPVDDPRLALFGMIAGGASAVALLGTTAAWRFLVTRKRKLEQQVDAATDAEADAWASMAPVRSSR